MGLMGNFRFPLALWKKEEKCIIKAFITVFCGYDIKYCQSFTEKKKDEQY